MEENIPLAPFTTLGVGGPARYFVEVKSEAALVEAVEWAAGLPLFVLGGGSNLVVADDGFHGVVLRMGIAGPFQFEEREQLVECNVPAGMDWDALVFSACERRYGGVECLAGIPGSVGGTPVQNVGAYGQEVSDTITSVRALDLMTMEFVSLSAAECGFRYRRSIFNTTERGRYIVTSVKFRFGVGRVPELKYAELKRHFAGKSPTPMEVYEAVRAIRRDKGMLLVEGDPDCRSAGSFFKNPVVDEDVFEQVVSGLGVGRESVPHWPGDDGRVKLAAAWLVEQAGFHKGFALSRAGISSKHTLAVVNRGGATAGEILALRDEVQRRVRDRFGVELEQEPVMVG